MRVSLRILTTEWQKEWRRGAAGLDRRHHTCDVHSCCVLKSLQTGHGSTYDRSIITSRPEPRNHGNVYTQWPNGKQIQKIYMYCARITRWRAVASLSSLLQCIVGYCVCIQCLHTNILINRTNHFKKNELHVSAFGEQMQSTSMSILRHRPIQMKKGRDLYQQCQQWQRCYWQSRWINRGRCRRYQDLQLDYTFMLKQCTRRSMLCNIPVGSHTRPNISNNQKTWWSSLHIFFLPPVPAHSSSSSQDTCASFAACYAWCWPKMTIDCSATAL